MRWLLIFALVIVEIILVLLIIPVGLKLDASQSSVVLFAKVFGINIRLYPRPAKKAAKAKKPKEKKPIKEKKGKNTKPSEQKASPIKESTEPNDKPAKGKIDINAQNIISYISFASDAFKLAVRGIYISNFKLDLRLHSDDAAKTALMYGSACSVLTAAIPKLEKIFRVGKRSINVYPEFEGNGGFQLNMTVMAVPVQLIAVAAVLYIKWKKLTQKDKVVQK